MFHAGVNAFKARERFGHGVDTPGGPVWSAQSFTRLPDGHAVLTGGEHEDSYDPDFNIYNGVIVVCPDGKLAFYGYPEEVFPPPISTPRP